MARDGNGMDMVTRAKWRAIGLGFDTVQDALARGLGVEPGAAEVSRLRMAIWRGLVKRPSVEEASRVLKVPIDYWYNENEAEVRAMAIAKPPEATNVEQQEKGATPR